MNTQAWLAAWALLLALVPAWVAQEVREHHLAVRRPVDLPAQGVRKLLQQRGPQLLEAIERALVGL